MSRTVLFLLGLLAAAAQAGVSPDRWRAVRDSLGDIEPWRLRSWLAERGLQDYYKQNSHRPESTGLRCVGRWSYGPALKLSLRVTPDDTVACLARGSGASIIRFRSRDSLSLDLLSDIDCYGIVSRAIIQDTLVFCGMRQGGTGIEVWGISDLTSPHRLSYVYLPPIMDIAVQDTFLYATGYQDDSLRIFNIRDPRNPFQVGACSDSGFPMYVSGNYCYLADQYGLNIVDVSDPANPHRAASIGGFEALSVAVRDTLCFVGTYNSTDFALRVYNVSNPATPFPIGSLSGVEASDIYLPPTCDTVLYTPKLHVINITNPRSPRLLGFVDCPGWDYGVTAVPALNYALVADHFEGLAVVDIAGPTSPVLDTTLFPGDQARDIYIDQGRAYVASYHAGMLILDVSNPAAPQYLGDYDTVGVNPRMNSAAALDSFAYVGWPMPRMFSIDVADPRHPERAAGCEGMFGYPEDMVVRESLVYVAENRRLQVVNVARPRSPVLVGSCVDADYTWDLDLEGNLAAVAHTISLQLIDVAYADSPRVVGSWPGDVSGVDIVDTVAYVTASYTGIVSLSVANPASPYVLDSLHLTDTLWWNDVVVHESVAYVGGERIWAVDVSDPRNLRLIPGATWTPPYLVRRLCYHSPHVYAVCYEGGVCILESTATAIAEPPLLRAWPAALSVAPSVAADRVVVRIRGATGQLRIRVYDVTGRTLEAVGLGAPGPDGIWLELCLTGQPPGVYVVRAEWAGGACSQKVVKSGRRR